MSGPPNFGPWQSGISETERIARLRCLRAIGHLLVGKAAPLLDALRSAEADPSARDAAAVALETLPALSRRRILSAYLAVNAPQKISSGRQ